MALDDINMLPKRVRTMEQMADLLQAEKQMFDRLYREIYELFSQGSINNNVTLTKPRLEYISSLFAENPCRVDEYSECLTIHIVVLRNSGRPTSVKTLVDGVDVLIPAHLRYQVVLEAGIGLQIGTMGRGYRYRSPWTGRPYAGTEPWRNTRGGLAHEELEIEVAADKHPYKLPMSGTVPWRNIRGGLGYGQLTAESAGHGWSYHSETAGRTEAGTVPGRARSAALEEKVIRLDAEAREYLYTVPLTGGPEAGTYPDRDTGVGVESSAFYTGAEAEGFHYKVPMCGTSCCKS